MSIDAVGDLSDRLTVVEHGHDHFYQPIPYLDVTRKGWLARSWERAKRPGLFALFAILLAGFVLFAVLALPLWIIPRGGLTPAELVQAQNDLRGVLLQGAAGVAVIVGLYFTARGVQLTRAGHITDRFARAVELIGSDIPERRIGGLFAIERIMWDFATYRPVGVEVLLSFIGQRCERMGADGWSKSPTKIEPEALTALSILARRE